tara:strand:+ start:2159 stop:2626 length:468 start_codon:yes stop_codon:yes gene_type:complete
MASVIPYARYVQEIHTLIRDGAVINTPRDGSDIVCPSQEFLEREFLPALDKVTKPYVVNTYDCEDFCAEAHILMTRSVLANGVYHGKGHSLGYAEVIIPSGVALNGVSDGVHATNMVRTDNGGWFFMEPQPGPAQRLENPLDAFDRGIRIRRYDP